MTRRAYSTECRFFRDSDLVSRVRWMEAAPDAEVLPFPSVILSRQQEQDDWLPIEPGEVADALRTTTLERAPAGTGTGHICGTEEEFNNGEVFDPTREPLQYGSYGLPLCCDPPMRVFGGAGAGGRNTLRVYRGLAVYGGAGGGGRVTVTNGIEPRVYGGAGAGGRCVISNPDPIRCYGGAGGSGRGRFNDLSTWLRDVHGLYVFTPTVTRDHWVELWGAGAGGQIGTDPFAPQGGGGGGGGAYVRSKVFLIAGEEYEVIVAEGGHPVHSGAGTTNPPTQFDGSTVLAESGSTANPPNAGPGGSIGGSIGQIRRHGGNGAATVGVENGGGGGGSAGPLDNGNDALGITGGQDWLFKGARGGDGQFTIFPVDGHAPGGGGGGRHVGTLVEHGAGADGQVLISWNEIL